MVHVFAPGFDVTVYPVIGRPLFAGAVHETATWLSPITPAGAPGASGTVAGANVADDVDGGLSPMLLVAVTAKVYPVPFVRPVTTQDSAAVVHVFAPGFELTVYTVIGLFPSSTGGDHETVAWLFPGTALTSSGGPGSVPGMTISEVFEGGPSPTRLDAVTRKV